MVEFGDKCDAALGQAVNPLFPIVRRLARLSGFFRERAAQVRNSRSHLLRVFRSQRDGLPIMMQHAIGNSRRDGAIDYWGNAHHLRKLEISRPELFEHLDCAVGFGPAHFQILWAEIIPFFAALFV